MQVLGDHGQRVVGLEGQATRGQLVQHRTQGVQVGAAVKALAQRQFRRQVKHSTGDQAFAGNARGDGTGQAEIG